MSRRREHWLSSHGEESVWLALVASSGQVVVGGGWEHREISWWEVLSKHLLTGMPAPLLQLSRSDEKRQLMVLRHLL